MRLWLSGILHKARDSAENLFRPANAEHSLKAVFHGEVAVAAGRLQRRPIPDGDAAPAVADHSRPLQRARGDTDGGPVNAEHESEELLRHLKRVAVRAIMR